MLFNQKCIKKYRVVFGAILLQMCIGSIYTWSLFNQPLVDKFSFDQSEVVVTYSIAIFIFALTTMYSGKLQENIGPKKVATIGAILYGCGVMLTSFATTLLQFYLYFGVIGGIGVGFAYVAPLSTCIKWFTDRKGLITGVAVGAFGLGSLAFKPLIQSLLATTDVSQTFLYLGAIYLIMGVIGAQLLVLPPAQTEVNSQTVNDSQTYSVKEMMSTSVFYLMWLTYFFATMSGLLVIGMAMDIGLTLAKMNELAAANAVSIAALFNSSGRLVWGSLSDKLGSLNVIIVMLVLTTLSMFGMSVFEMNPALYFTLLAIVAFCFGGFLAVFPALTGDLFGVKNIGVNYGFVYQAYGLAALVGPMLVTLLGGLKQAFVMTAILSFLGVILSLRIYQLKQTNKFRKDPKIKTVKSTSCS